MKSKKIRKIINDTSYKSDDRLWKKYFYDDITDIFILLQKNKISTCKNILHEMEEIIKINSDSISLRKYFFFNLLKIREEKNIIHHNLEHCEKFIETKVKKFFYDVEEMSGFPTLCSDVGQNYVFSFTGKILPLSTYHLEVAVIPKFILPKMSCSDFLKFIFYVFFKIKGFGPVLEFHLPKMNQKLTADLLFQDFLSVGEILLNNQKIKGTYQSNWFLDPALADISPHFIEIQELSKKYGALIVSLGENTGVVSDAIAKSSKRRLLYEKGLYKPKRMVRVWSKNDIIKLYNNYYSFVEMPQA